MSMPDLPLLLGHRGLRGPKAPPENTFAAFDLALQHGCHGFEFDVRLTSDGKAVICHDAKFRAIAVSEFPFAQLSGLCTLEEVLKRYSRRAFLDIELKVAGLAGPLLDALQKYPPQRGYTVSSFLPGVIHDLHQQAAAVPLGLICETKEQLAVWNQLPVGYVIPHHTLTTADLLQQAHEHGKRVFVWTVNRAADMLRFAQQQVDGIISDDPELLVKTVRSVDS
jgi:glycerophosphoryl diester phosphodiesterase